MKWVFFGSSEFSVSVLEELKKRNLSPDLIVTTPDKPKGRKLILTPNSTKKYAMDSGTKFVEFKSLKDPTKNEGGVDAAAILSGEKYDFFLVASYGRIIPISVFNIPKHKTLNIHPSLLPKYRGASPMKSQILNDENPVGTSIMVIDEGMDTGPVIAQKEVSVPNWPVTNPELEKIMAKESAELFVSIIDKWLAGEIEAVPQPEEGVTICGKIEKEDGLLNLEDDARKNLLKIKAFSDWPRAYFFTQRGGKNTRVIVTDATLDQSGSTSSPQVAQLKILKVIPEGKKEMNYEDFRRGLKM